MKIWFECQWQVNAPTSNPDEFTVELDYLNISNTLVTTQLLFENSDDGAFNQTTSAHAVVNLANHQAGDDVGQLRFKLLELNQNNGTRIQLDNVQVKQVPEPSSLALFGLALGLLSLHRRRV